MTRGLLSCLRSMSSFSTFSLFYSFRNITASSLLRIECSRAAMTNLTDQIERCKASAACMAVDDNINGDCIVGIGSGTTMTYVLKRLVDRCKERGYSVKCIPTSYQSKQLIHDHDLPLTEIDRHPSIDVTIDGADEVDHNFVAIKGGGACLAQEKVVAMAAKRFVVVADHRKNSRTLGQSWKKGIPIEVLPMACNAVRHRICRMYQYARYDDLVVRIGKEKAGPVITDNSNLIIDWIIDPERMADFSEADWVDLSNQIKLIPGVIETGIFAKMIHAAYFGEADGSVTKKLSVIA